MNKTFVNWLLLATLTLIWGSSFILMKRGVSVFSGDQVGTIRMFVAFLSLTPFLYKHVNKAVLKHWKSFLGLGLFGSLLPGLLFASAQKGISSSLISIINALTPLFTLLITIAFFKERVRFINSVGIATGFIGATVLLVATSNFREVNSFLFVVYALLAAVCNAITVNIIKYRLGGVNAITCTVWGFLFVGPVSGVYLFSTDFVLKLNTVPMAWQSLGYVCLLGTLGTSLSIILFNVLIKNTSSIFGASVTYLMPIVAIMWGVSDGESVLPIHIICTIIILLGVYMVNAKKTVVKVVGYDRENRDSVTAKKKRF